MAVRQAYEDDDMKRIAVIGLALLSGCSLMESRNPPPPDVAGILNSAYQGAPVTMVLRDYGAPLREMAVGGGTVYSWERDHAQYFQTQPPALWHCQMDAYAGPSGTVTQMTVNGNMGACVTFLR